MDRASLKRFLAAGLSLDQIGKRVGRDASTVGYWVKKYGLSAVHHERHAARGGVARELLEPLVEQRLSVAKIAETLDRSEPTIRYWLDKHGLETAASKRRREAKQAKRGGHATVKLTCRHHGLSDFWSIPNSSRVLPSRT